MIRSDASRAGACALAGMVLLLSGCAPTPSPSPETTPQETPSAAASTPAAAETVVPVELTFEAGDELEADSIFAEWGDPFAQDPEFSVLAEDDGSGQWAYTDETNGCSIFFYQGTLTDVAAGSTDSASTISALAAIGAGKDSQITPEIVEQYGDEFALDQMQDGATVSFWGLGAEMTDGSSWVDSARYFTATDAVYYFSIGCAAGTSAYDEHDRIVGEIGLPLRVVDAASGQ